MLNLKVKYFLNEEGFSFFQIWYKRILALTSIQDAFCNMHYEVDNGTNPIIYLSFENQEKLDKWTETKTHDEVAFLIEKHFIKPAEVEVLDA